jgi:uncharacterized membrane protein HdeD (DUF308 family)
MRPYIISILGIITFGVILYTGNATWFDLGLVAVIGVFMSVVTTFNLAPQMETWRGMRNVVALNAGVSTGFMFFVSPPLAVAYAAVALAHQLTARPVEWEQALMLAKIVTHK